MGKILSLVLLLNTSTILIAQDDKLLLETRPLNSINFSLFGDASAISFNYEKLFLVNQSFIVSSKLGIGYGGQLFTSDRFLTIPHYVTGNYGKDKHFFEFGIGGTIVVGKTTQPYLLYPLVGYRFLPLKFGKFNFRVFAQIPFTGIDTDDIFFMPVGCSFGVSL